jgi:autotransporter-associated beta strand protein
MAGRLKLGALLAAGASLAGLLAPLPSAAQDASWTGVTSDDWFAPGNWGPAGVPSADSKVTINTRTPNATVIRAAGARSAALAVGVAAGSNALLTINSGGTLVTGGDATIGDAGGSGEVLAIGAGSAWTIAGALRLGGPAGPGSGRLTIAQGAMVTVGGGAGTVSLGANGGVASLFIGGDPCCGPGTLRAAGVNLGPQGLLRFLHNATNYDFAPVISGSGNVSVVGGTTRLLGDSSAFTGTTTIGGGGSLYIGNADFSGFGIGGETGNLGGTIVNNGVLVLNRDRDFTFTAIISGSGSLANNIANPFSGNSGVTTLPGVHSYTGATAIYNGTLLVTGSIASSSGVTVAGGRLAGTGTVARTTVTGGGLLPGALASIGTLTVAGNLTMTGGTYFADVTPAAADHINISGTATLGGRFTAIARRGAYTPGQYAVLTAAGGRNGTFGSVSIAGSFSGLVPTLSYTANSVLLSLAPFTASDEGRWLAAPASDLWNTGGNWQAGALPGGTARFGPSSRTTVAFARGMTQIGRLLFDADAPAYTFNLDGAIAKNLMIFGEGIVNNSAFRPSIFILHTGQQLTDGSTLSFFNASTAGNAHIFSVNVGDPGFATHFYDNSSAANALIENRFRGTAFHDTSTAGKAAIVNEYAGLGGSVAFFDSSTAGSAQITNSFEIGGIGFFDTASAGSATIVNRAFGSFVYEFAGPDATSSGIGFAGSSTAANATITNDSGNTAFFSSSSAGNATIVNSGAGPATVFYNLLFTGNSTAAAATITNNQGGITIFEDQATAGTATIVNNQGGTTLFYQTGVVGTPTITNNQGGTTRFLQKTQGDGVTVVNNAGGILDISEDPTEAPSFVAPTVAIGSVSGAGNVFLGARNLMVGGLNRDDAIAGLIADGGEFKGTGGSLTKIGGGTLTLTGANSFTGATTISAGTLQLGNGGATGSLAGNIVNNAALVIDRSGTLTLSGVISGAGSFTQNGSVTTTLSAASPYTGATTINGGALLVNGSIASSSLVTVNSGATLGGTGTVGRTTIASGGALSPGLSVGTLAVNGDLVFSAGARYFAEVAANAADRVNVSGSASLAGTLRAIAAGGPYAPGQFTLLSASGGLSGTFALTTEGNFGGLAARLSYDANTVFLTLAAAAADIKWRAAPVTDNWNTGANWEGDAVPADIAVFGASTRTSISFSPGTTSIGELRFEAGAPAYAFGIDCAQCGGGSPNPDTLNITGAGIVNASSARPSFTVIGHGIVGGTVFPAQLNFRNTSTAGNAEIFTRTAPTNTTLANFRDNSNAGTALITNLGASTGFYNTASAGNATINNSLPGDVAGSTAFFNNSSAASATIRNAESGNVAFFNNATAGAALIDNRGTSGLFNYPGVGFAGVMFLDTSRAGAARITNDGGNTIFANAATADTATIANRGADAASAFYNTQFTDTASAGSATITNDQGGVTTFARQATAASAMIVNNAGGSTQFFDTASGGAARITNNNGGRLFITQSATAQDATIVNNAGGVVDISSNLFQSVSVRLDRLSGPGNIALGNRTLILGGIGSDFALAGLIADGGTAGGVGGSLTKIGGGTLTLTGANTFTGATTISAGTLQLGNGGATGSLAGDIVNNAAFVIDRSGALTLTGIVSGTGSFTQNGSVTTTLSAANAYSGATTVNGGALLVNGSIAASSLVTVNNDGMLGGTGTVGRTTIASGGTLSPGLSIGALTIAGNLTFNSGSTYLAEVAPAAADRVNVTGTAALAGTLNALSLGGTFAAGSRYTLLNAAGGLTGAFSSLVTQGSFGGLVPTLSYSGTDVILTLAQAGPVNTATTTLTDALVFNTPTITVQRVSLFETRIIGRLSGGTPLYDQTVKAAFGSTPVLDALAAARLAITAAGSPGVVIISDPVLVSRTVGSATSSASLFSLGGTSQTVTTVTTFGPATVTTGDTRSCAGAIGTLPAGAKPSCAPPGGTPFTVESGTVNVNTVTRTDYAVNEARTDTITETTHETYELTGTVVPIGTVHAAVQSGLFELGERFLARMGEEGAPHRFGRRGEGATSDKHRGWAEYYGYRARIDGRGGILAERRDAHGFAVGLSLFAGEAFSIGVAVDRGRLDLAVPGSGETAGVELTQFAASVRYDDGPFSLGLAFTYGSGDVDSRRALGDITTSAGYGVDLIGGVAELRYAIDAGDWRIVPVAALDWLRVGSDAFAEAGTFGLRAPNTDRERTRATFGLEAGTTIPFADGSRLDLTLSGRYAAILSGGERTLPVAFTLVPGTPLVMRGLSERDSAILGVQAAYHCSPGLSLYLAYSGQFGAGYDAQGAVAGVSVRW